MDWWIGTYAIGGFAPIIQLAFGANLAYAVLVQFGHLQGNYLVERATKLQAHTKEALSLLTAENGNYSAIDIGTDETQAARIVSGAKDRIEQAVFCFGIISIFSAFFSLMMLYFCGAFPEYRLSSTMTLVFCFILFLPVPVGIIWTLVYMLVCERRIQAVYNDAVSAIAHVRSEPQLKSKETLERLRAELERKPENFLRKILFRQYKERS